VKFDLGQAIKEHRDILELIRALKRHEEYTQSNRSSLFSVTLKFHENEHYRASQHVTIMNLLVQQ
jgi:hypothetical protein